MAGRPSKLTTEVAGRIAHHTRAGNYADTAAAFVGITRQTFHNWMRDGAALPEDLQERAEYRRWSEAIDAWQEHLAWNPQSEKPQPARGAALAAPGEPAFRAFFDAIQRAQAEAEIRDMAGIGGHGRKEWTALAWRRERMQPDRYGRRSTVSLTSPTDEPVQVSAQVASIVFHLPLNGTERIVVPAGADPTPATGAPRPRQVPPRELSGPQRPEPRARAVLPAHRPNARLRGSQGGS